MGGGGASSELKVPSASPSHPGQSHRGCSRDCKVRAALPLHLHQPSHSPNGVKGSFAPGYGVCRFEAGRAQATDVVRAVSVTADSGPEEPQEPPRIVPARRPSVSSASGEPRGDDAQSRQGGRAEAVPIGFGKRCVTVWASGFIWQSIGCGRGSCDSACC